MRMSQNDSLRIPPSISIILGCVCACIALFFSFFQSAFLKNAVHTSGVVIDHKKFSSGKPGQYNYHDVVNFKTLDGTAITFTTTETRQIPFDENGTIVPVIYDPQNPQEASIDDVKGKWSTPLVFGGFALYLLGSAVVQIIKKRAIPHS